MNKDGKLLSFDVDSVLLDTEEVIFKYIEKEYGKIITSKDVTHWTYYIENFPSVLEYFGNPEIYQKVEPVQGMIYIMEKVIKNYGSDKIQLITSSHEKIKEAKELAINRFYGHIEGWDNIDVIHVGLDHSSDENCHHKHFFSEDTILIDDAIHNMKDHLSYNHNNMGILVDFGYGWNQNYEDRRSRRVHSPEDIFKTIKDIV